MNLVQTETLLKGAKVWSDLFLFFTPAWRDARAAAAAGAPSPRRNAGWAGAAQVAMPRHRTVKPVTIITKVFGESLRRGRKSFICVKTHLFLIHKRQNIWFSGLMLCIAMINPDLLINVNILCFYRVLYYTACDLDIHNKCGVGKMRRCKTPDKHNSHDLSPFTPARQSTRQVQCRDTDKHFHQTPSSENNLLALV